MVEFIRRVYEDGKITIPKEVRELHAIEPGDFIEVRVRLIRKGNIDEPEIPMEKDQ